MSQIIKFDERSGCRANGGYRSRIGVSGYELTKSPYKKGVIIMTPFTSRGKLSESINIEFPVSIIDNLIFCLEELKEEINKDI